MDGGFWWTAGRGARPVGHLGWDGRRGRGRPFATSWPRTGVGKGRPVGQPLQGRTSWSSGKGRTGAGGDGSEGERPVGWVDRRPTGARGAQDQLASGGTGDGGREPVGHGRRPVDLVKFDLWAGGRTGRADGRRATSWSRVRGTDGTGRWTKGGNQLVCPQGPEDLGAEGRGRGRPIAVQPVGRAGEGGGPRSARRSDQKKGRSGVGRRPRDGGQAGGRQATVEDEGGRRTAGPSEGGGNQE